MTPADPDPLTTADLPDELRDIGLDHDVERLRARLAELERERDGLRDFAGRAAHELVAPLVMTEAYSAMIASRLDPAEHADVLHDLDAIARSAAHARRLVEALLGEARAGNRPLAKRPVKLDEVVGDVRATLAPEFAGRRADVQVGPLPVVPGDAELLCSVFTNLLVNALRYGPREGMSIRVEATREGGAWRVAVDSDGPSIPPEDCERIFGAYRRGRQERRTRGAGLGLAICQRIVERHGGSIGVRPRTGGNVFSFTLPVE